MLYEPKVIWKKEKFGYIIEKLEYHPWGNYRAYLKTGWLSVHHNDSEKQVLEQAMKELGKVLEV